MAGYDANVIADLFLWLAANERPEEPEWLTNLKLQKLLYYAQGWSLTEYEQPLFDDRIEAWSHGPAVHSVWKRFEPSGKRPLVDEVPAQRPEVDDAALRLVRSVWTRYGAHSAWSLADLSHQEEPWVTARAGLAPAARSNREIDRSALKREFDRKLSDAKKRLHEHLPALKASARANSKRLAPWLLQPPKTA